MSAGRVVAPQTPASSWRRPGPIPRDLSMAIGANPERPPFAKLPTGVMGPGFRQDDDRRICVLTASAFVEASAGESGERRKKRRAPYFFFVGPKSGCQPASLRVGAATITLALSFFGFLVSRLLRCCPLAMIVVSCEGSNSLGSTGCSIRPRKPTLASPRPRLALPYSFVPLTIMREPTPAPRQ